MTGIVSAGIGVGTMVIPPLAGWLISTYDWRLSYIIVGSLALVLIMLAAQFLRHDPGQMGYLPYGDGEVNEKVELDGIDLGNRALSLSEAIHTRQFWMCSAIFFLFVFCVQTILVHIVIHATGLGIPEASAVNIMSIIGGLSIAGRVIVGGVADRIGNKLTLTISFSLMAVALFWLVIARELWMLYLFAAIFGFVYGGTITLESPIAAELFGMSSHGVILGGIAFISTVGGAIGPVLAGHIFDIGSSYQPAFLVCIALSIIAIILALFLRPITSRNFN